MAGNGEVKISVLCPYCKGEMPDRVRLPLGFQYICHPCQKKFFLFFAEVKHLEEKGE